MFSGMIFEKTCGILLKLRTGFNESKKEYKCNKMLAISWVDTVL
jgi:hypothetical protein